MLGIRLERPVEAQLEALAERLGKPKSDHAREPIRRYLLTNEDKAKRQSMLVSATVDEKFERDTRGWTK